MQASSLKRIIITGSNKGIGYGILENLAQKPEKYHFIMAIRSADNGKEALEQLSKLVPDIKDRTIIQELDITDEKSRNTFVDWISKTFGSKGIDCLINNAGMAFKGDAFNEEVVRITFATNYYGTVDFTDKMKPYIADNGKIIMIGSSVGKVQKLSPELRVQFNAPDLNREKLNSLLKKFYDDVAAGTYAQNGWPKSAYGMSKIGVNLYARILSQDEDIIKRNIQCYTCCPGWVRTDMAGPKAPRTIQEGAVCPVYLVDLPWKIDPKLQGKFFYDCQVTPLDQRYQKIRQRRKEQRVKSKGSKRSQGSQGSKRSQVIPREKGQDISSKGVQVNLESL